MYCNERPELMCPWADGHLATRISQYGFYDTTFSPLSKYEHASTCGFIVSGEEPVVDTCSVSCQCNVSPPIQDLLPSFNGRLGYVNPTTNRMLHMLPRRRRQMARRLIQAPVMMANDLEIAPQIRLLGLWVGSAVKHAHEIMTWHNDWIGCYEASVPARQRTAMEKLAKDYTPEVPTKPARDVHDSIRFAHNVLPCSCKGKKWHLVLLNLLPTRGSALRNSLPQVLPGLPGARPDNLYCC
jgi:hypothetical protein